MFRKCRLTIGSCSPRLLVVVSFTDGKLHHRPVKTVWRSCRPSFDSWTPSRRSERSWTGSSRHSGGVLELHWSDGVGPLVSADCTSSSSCTSTSTECGYCKYHKKSSYDASLSACLPPCLSVCLSLCRPVCPSIYLSVCLPVCALPVALHLCLL